jgi:hypothetical protein
MHGSATRAQAREDPVEDDAYLGAGASKGAGACDDEAGFGEHRDDQPCGRLDRNGLDVAGGRHRRWRLNHSPLYLDFLEGRREFACTPWVPSYSLLGWQRSCDLLTDGYAATWQELLGTTDWTASGRGRGPRCGNCMAHCGYEPSAALATTTSCGEPARPRHPLIRGHTLDRRESPPLRRDTMIVAGEQTPHTLVHAALACCCMSVWVTAIMEAGKGHALRDRDGRRAGHRPGQRRGAGRGIDL